MAGAPGKMFVFCSTPVGAACHHISYARSERDEPLSEMLVIPGDNLAFDIYILGHVFPFHRGSVSYARLCKQ
jgi:hypothetical protein